MIRAHFLDDFSVGALFLLTVVILLVAIEAGFLIGRRRQEKPVKAQTSQVRAIMGATLGLLAFMLAFTFANGQQHYEQRIAYMVEEANLAGDAFFLAEGLAPAERDQARRLIREYVDDRVRMAELFEAGELDAAVGLIVKAEGLQLQLWDLANGRGGSGSPGAAPDLRNNAFRTAVLALMDLQALRIEAAVANRIPMVIWLTLYFTGFLSMLVMGYQAGLVTRRSPMATFTLAIAFATVMMLITDLDRPVQSLFRIDNTVVVNLVQRMDRVLGVDANGS
jgi:hypothetical protein